MFDFTKRAKRIINEYAQQEAKRLGNDMIGAEHILLGLLREEASVAIKILKNLNINLNDLKKEVERCSKQGGSNLLIDISPNPDRYQKVIDYSKEEAKRLKHNYVGTEHILLALLRDNNNVAGTALSNFNVNYSVIKGEILRILGVSVSGASTSTKRTSGDKLRTPTLDEFTRDLTQLAKEKKLLPVIGRNQEIERVIQILCRKTKNNPVLIGEAGVGKTAIVEGLAERIIDHSVPDTLFSKRVIVLDLASLIAGTKYRGEFEDRLKKIMREIHNSRNIIVFIDELHTIIGAGAAEGAVDAANMLKPALARGEIQCIGATTIAEFRKYVEKDSALERRFQSILVKEPSYDDAILILRGLKNSFEKHHRVFYPDETLTLAVQLAERYISDRYLPDKAIDVIDEAGARARLTYFSRPSDLLEMEENIRKLAIRKDELVKAQEYENAAKVRDEINTSRELLGQKIKNWQDRVADHSVQITTEDISSVMSLWTGIPLSRIEQDEATRLLKIEEEISKRIAGQKDAIERIAKAVQRSRTGLGDKRRPAGSFMFLGPTGVGKTELARVLSDFLFEDEKKLFRLDMSEYMEPHSISKLIGSPPGYVGYEDAGLLCEFVRRNPYSVVLFDEIEKAHRDIFNILLQILDDGCLTDTHGRKVNFSKCLIIMTSNIGAREIQKGSLGFSENKENHKKKSKEKVIEQLKKHFNPEFLNRIDETISFDALTIENVRKIVGIMIHDMNENIFSKELHIELEPSGLEYITYKSYDETYGARPLRRLLQKEIENYLAMSILEGKITEPSEFVISCSSSCKSKEDTKEAKLTFVQRPWEGYKDMLSNREKKLEKKQSHMKDYKILSEQKPVIIKKMKTRSDVTLGTNPGSPSSSLPQTSSGQSN